MPMVRMNNPIRSFYSAKTCSTRERTVDLIALAPRMACGMSRPLGFLGRMWDRRPFFSMNASLAAEQ
jgi:hypothetical protein